MVSLVAPGTGCSPAAAPWLAVAASLVANRLQGARALGWWLQRVSSACFTDVIATQQGDSPQSRDKTHIPWSGKQIPLGHQRSPYLTFKVNNILILIFCILFSSLTIWCFTWLCNNYENIHVYLQVTMSQFLL